MYQVKRMFVRHIEENLPIYIMMLCVFVLGAIGGLVFSRNVPESISVELTTEISTLTEGLAQGNYDKIQILKTAAMKNLRVILFLFVGGVSVVFIPLVFVTVLGYGFSMGFTIGYMSLSMGGTGLALALISAICSLTISVPLYIMLSVISYKNCKLKKHKGSSLTFYILICLLFFLLSWLSVFADAFILPYLLMLTCS